MMLSCIILFSDFSYFILYFTLFYLILSGLVLSYLIYLALPGLNDAKQTIDQPEINLK